LIGARLSRRNQRRSLETLGMTPTSTGLAFTVILISIAVSACNESQQQAVAPAAKTQPPPVIPPPPRPPPSYERDSYASLDDCAYDWGQAQKCTPVVPGSATNPPGAKFLGPIYAKAYREETQAQLRKEAVDGGYSPRPVTETSDRSIGKTEVKP
jgi:hypothetical protein